MKLLFFFRVLFLERSCSAVLLASSCVACSSCMLMRDHCARVLARACSLCSCSRSRSFSFMPACKTKQNLVGSTLASVERPKTETTDRCIACARVHVLAHRLHACECVARAHARARVAPEKDPRAHAYSRAPTPAHGSYLKTCAPTRPRALTRVAHEAMLGWDTHPCETGIYTRATHCLLQLGSWCGPEASGARQTRSKTSSKRERDFLHRRWYI